MSSASEKYFPEGEESQPLLDKSQQRQNQLDFSSSQNIFSFPYLKYWDPRVTLKQLSMRERYESLYCMHSAHLHFYGSLTATYKKDCVPT
jgi:hypothetical protein